MNFISTGTKFLSVIMLILILVHITVNAQSLDNIHTENSYFKVGTPYQTELFNLDMSYQPLDEEQKMPMNTFWKGAGTGFGIGGSIGVAFGLLGKDWVLNDGTIVPRWQHAVIDMFIFAVPFVTMGGVVGVRQPRSDLSPSRLHVAGGFGYSTVMTYNSILRAFDDSGIEGEIPHWFGYLHYPNGEESSTPYTWNIAADYNLSEHFSIGLSFNNIVKQEVNEAGHTHTENEAGIIGVNEWTKGEVYTLVADYIFNPIQPENKSRIEIAAGVGVGFQSLLIGGSFSTVDPDFKFREQIFTPYFRTTFDYYSRKTLSLQLKIGYRPLRDVFVPERSNGDVTVNAHNINYRALEWTVGIRRHFSF